MEEIGDILKKLESVRDVDSSEHREDVATSAPGCPRCGDRGWITEDVPVSHPDFGLVVNCDCHLGHTQQYSREKLGRYSNLGGLSRISLAALAANSEGSHDPAPDFSDAIETASAFAESPIGWLVLVGPNGSGKTKVAAAIANRRIELGHVALFVHVPDLMDYLRANLGPTYDISYRELFERVRSAPLLILDDLGAASSSAASLQKLQQIVNHRYNEELPTVFTTSAELHNVDAYIRARLETPGLSRILSLRGDSTAVGLGSVPPELAERMTFTAFDTSGNNASATERANLEMALEASRSFADMRSGWLTLHGPTGVGKTHLAVAIAAESARRGRKVFYAFVPDLLDHLRSSFDPSSPVTYDQEFERVRSAEVLVLDDLESHRKSAWAEAKLYQLMVHRHDRRLPTVITTRDAFSSRRGRGSNWSDGLPSVVAQRDEASRDELHEVDLDPIRSRANDKAVGMVVAMYAPDYRAKSRRDGPSPTVAGSPSIVS